jgi:Uma2 family endonuclease
MSTVEKKVRVTVQEYLEYLDSIQGRAEFHDGVIYDMAGSSDNHALIGMNVGTALNNVLADRPCRVFGADSILAIDQDESVVMPDVHVVCGDNEPSKQNARLHANALLVVEVLSESTAFFDRKKKFDRYKLVSTLREYVLIEQNEARVEVFSLNALGKWEHNAYHGMEATVSLLSIGKEIAMAAIYRNVKLEEE